MLKKLEAGINMTNFKVCESYFTGYIWKCLRQWSTHWIFKWAVLCCIRFEEVRVQCHKGWHKKWLWMIRISSLKIREKQVRREGEKSKSWQEQMRVKKDHFRDKTICVGMAMRRKERMNTSREWWRIRKKGRESECGESSEVSEREKGTEREGSSHSRHMVSIDPRAMWPSPGFVMVLCKVSLCPQACSPVCVGVVMSSACLSALSVLELEEASVSALGIHCV